jgi:uncharacterized protein
MRFERESPGARFFVRTYEPGQIRIGEQRFTCSVILSADKIVPDWRPRNITDFRATDLQPVLELDPEIVLLGSGDRHSFPEPVHLGVLYRAGIGLEVMDTGAACRTFNLLVAEGRKVAAALIVEPH